MVFVFMALSPSARQRRFGLSEQTGDYATFKFQPLPRQHLRVSLVPLLMKIWRREAVLYTYNLPYKRSQTLS
jgi:hypothetical protein